MTRLRELATGLLLGAVVGLAAGAAAALFLWLLDVVGGIRGQQRWLVFLLPVAGLVIGWLYQRFGEPIRGGSDLIIDTLHDGGPRLPLRMAPMVLFGTLATHLFGGSAGREGTAVQMGASLADALGSRWPSWRRSVLVAGVAGGFGAVFGTPVAGAVFGLEFLTTGRLEYRALLPALTAAFVGDATTRGLGIVHTAYPSVAWLPLDAWVVGKWLLLAGAVAAVAWLFITATHWIKQRSSRWALPLRMAAGGALVVGLWQLVGSDDYLGLGVPTISRAFVEPLGGEVFALKLLFTAITLGAGFLGGEVTPLFFVGAALGNTLGGWLGLPIELAAGVGMAALFAAAAHAPLSLSLMAVELCGAAILPHVLIVAVLAWLLLGAHSIYPAKLRPR